jgi:hypothetical protein
MKELNKNKQQSISPAGAALMKLKDAQREIEENHTESTGSGIICHSREIMDRGEVVESAYELTLNDLRAIDDQDEYY